MNLLKFYLNILVGLLVIAFIGLAFAQNINSQDNTNSSPGNKHVKAELVFDVENLPIIDNDSGKIARIGVHIKIEKGWHIYWQNPGEAGKATEIFWHLPEGWKASDLYWPIPERYIERGDIKTYAYTDEVLIYADLFIPPIVDQAEKEIEFGAEIKFLVCSDRCIPGKTYVNKSILLSAHAEEKAPKHYQLFNRFEALIPLKSSLGELEKNENFKVYQNSEENNQFSLYFVFNKEIEATNFLSLNSNLNILKSEVKNTNEKTYLKILFDGESGNLEQIDGVLVLKSDNQLKPYEISFLKKEVPKYNGEVLSGLSYNPFLTHSEEDPLLNEASAKNSSASLESNKKEVTKREQGSSAQTLLFALLMAFLGGIILNFMPCVLPILSIKLFGLLKAKERSNKQNLKDGIFFTLGILISFFSLALIFVLLKVSGQNVGWGFHFQSPTFLFFMILFLFMLSLGFFDLIKFSIPGIYKLNDLGSKDHSNDAAKCLVDGFLVSILSTPCTAPFLGTALAFAFTQNNLALFLIFITIGLGLSFPYLLISLNPKLLRYFPNPGTWMNHLKHFMGFGLIGTLIWLVHVFGKLVSEGVTQVSIALLSLSLFVWVFHIKKNISKFSFVVYLISSTLLIAVVSSISSIVVTKELSSDSLSLKWLDFKKVDYQTLDKPVLIDFTAEWCITCKYNENFVLSNQEIQNIFRKKHYTLIKADWTSGDEEISKALKKFGGNGVPHYVVIKENGQVSVLDTILSVDKLKNIL